MSTALVRHNQNPSQVSSMQLANQPSTGEIDLFQLGRVFAESGYFNDARDMAQAVVRILAGREMGFEAFTSMANIHIVKGKCVMGATLIAAAIKKSGKYTFRTVEHTDDVCRLSFLENVNGTFESIGESSFSVEDAKKADLLGKENWSKYRKDMLFARAISRGAKQHCPDVFGGTVYVPGEIEDNQGEDSSRQAEKPANNVRSINQVKELAQPVAQPETDPLLDAIPDREYTDAENQAAINRIDAIYQEAEAAGQSKNRAAMVERARKLSGRQLQLALLKTERFGREKRLELIRKGLDTQKDWDTADEARYLAEFAVENLADASDDQIAAILDDLRKAKMI